MTTQRRGGGKPRKFTQAIKSEFIKEMASGKTALSLCEQHKVSRSGLWQARQDDPAFDAEYEQAACNGIMAFLDDARRAMETAEGRDEILKHKELLRHAEWLAEKRLAIFQPATRAEVKIDGPMVVGWNTIEGVANVLSNDKVDVRARTINDDSRAALPAAE
jgi:hypothetical protein